MRTHRHHGDHGQIALMDAMVFFAIALLICAFQLNALDRRSEPIDWPEGMSGRSDPSCVLPVLLRASIGTETYVRAAEALLVPAQTAVSDCLAAEAASLARGFNVEAFGELNSLVLGIAKNLTHPLLDPHVVLSSHVGEEQIILARIERNPPRSGVDIAAASCELPGSSNEVVAVTILLEPALLLEGRNV